MNNTFLSFYLLLQLLTTKCAIAETESLGSELYGAALILKRFLVRKCGHQPNPVSASECFLSLVGEKNDNHYFVATQVKTWGLGIT